MAKRKDLNNFKNQLLQSVIKNHYKVRKVLQGEIELIAECDKVTKCNNKLPQRVTGIKSVYHKVKRKTGG